MAWIQTYTGKQFWPFDPKPDDIDIIDIAHSLSLQCRFNGHCRTFYSVAEHCVRLSYIVPEEDALWGLLHDATEAYLCDVPRPIKRELPHYKEMEDRMLERIAVVFSLPWPIPESVKHADNVMLATEKRDLMAAPPASWELGVSPLEGVVVPISPTQAEADFLARYEELRGTS